MEYRILGDSGFSVPVLSLGTGTFGGDHAFFGKWGNTNVAQASRLVDICLDAGVNLFDTADVYSAGQAEEILGQAISGKRDKLLISTKATFGMSDEPNDVGSSRYHLIRSCEASLRRLNTDYIDIYTIHGFDAQTSVEETLRMVDFVFKGGNRGAISDVIGTLDVALWDLKAKINNEPLWKTLGGSSRYVKAYASDIGTPLSDDELRAFYETQAARGIAIGKLKVGLDREADLRRIGIMRDALATSGKDPVILIDSNEYWSPKQAIQNIRYFEQHYDIYWAEEPARRWDYDGLKQVSESVKAAVATGENLDHAADFRPLIQMRAADVLQIGRNVSGFTGAMRIAAMCEGFDIPVALMSSPGFYQAHLGTVMPNHIWMEVVDAGRDLMFDSDARIEDGWIVLGDRPGLGLVFDDT